MTYSISQAISESALQNKTVTLTDIDLEIDLLAACEGHVQTGNLHEFWGTDEECGEWRIHLDHMKAACPGSRP